MSWGELKFLAWTKHKTSICRKRSEASARRAAAVSSGHRKYRRGAKAWSGVNVTPTSSLVNKRGEIVKRFVGKADFAELHQFIDQLRSER